MFLKYLFDLVLKDKKKNIKLHKNVKNILRY